MAVDVTELFEEWAARLARDERPDPREFIDRAGPQGEELARMMDRYLRASRPPRPDEETVELVRAWGAGESPLAALRARQGVEAESVVDDVMRAFHLSNEKRVKVKRYYEELEAGVLDPRRLAGELVDVLAQALRTRPTQLFALRPWPSQLPPAPAMRRFSVPIAAAAATLRASQQPEPPDEVDRIFGEADVRPA